MLRADSIRPYGSSGEAATIHPAAQLRKRSGGFYPPLRVAAAEPPMGRLLVDPYQSESLKTSQMRLDLALLLSVAKGKLRFYKNEVLKDVLQ